MAKKGAKYIPEKVDGFGPADVKRIRAALRKVWSWSYPRRLCQNRCVGSGGFSYCERCGRRAPKIYIDHVHNVGDVDEGYIKRLFVSSYELQGLCKKCHDLKTKQERAKNK